MARPKEFVEDDALAAAVQRFWARGFEATSVRDLADAMGITGASLYNAFGDKQSLFERSLDHYVKHSFDDRSQRAEARSSPLQVIRAFFEEIIEFSLSDTQHKGCLIVNSALEVAPHDAAVHELISDVMVRGEAFFRRCVEAGQSTGEITRSQSADDLARHLLGLVLGIRVLARVRPERELLEGIIRPAFAQLEVRDASAGSGH
jgi:TetR/AcrR family transcriptional repressor of nem operon